jgi:hypothetical protein
MHKQIVAIEVNRQGVTPKIVDLDCAIRMHIMIKTWIAKP